MGSLCIAPVTTRYSIVNPRGSSVYIVSGLATHLTLSTLTREKEFAFTTFHFLALTMSSSQSPISFSHRGDRIFGPTALSPIVPIAKQSQVSAVDVPASTTPVDSNSPVAANPTLLELSNVNGFENDVVELETLAPTHTEAVSVPFISREPLTTSLAIGAGLEMGPARHNRMQEM